MAATGGSDLLHNKYVGKTSTMMRTLTNKYGDLSFCSDKVNENIIDDDNTLKQTLVNNHDIAANKGKIEGQLSLEHTFGLSQAHLQSSHKILHFI